MDLAELSITRWAHALAEHLGPSPVGLCATASVALWKAWHETMREALVFCIAFDGPVAHHVYLRRGDLLVDASGHQFETHKGHCYTIAQGMPRHVHHRHVLETSCKDEFMGMLRQVGWPAHQWPSPEKVRSLARAMQEQWRVQGNCARAVN